MRGPFMRGPFMRGPFMRGPQACVPSASNNGDARKYSAYSLGLLFRAIPSLKFGRSSRLCFAAWLIVRKQLIYCCFENLEGEAISVPRLIKGKISLDLFDSVE